MTRAEASILDNPRDGPALPEVWVRIPYAQINDNWNKLIRDGNYVMMAASVQCSSKSLSLLTQVQHWDPVTLLF